ncbi:MAG: WD40 repeat domain-containing protein, partial [Proteobacteria bacterium]|nr:WD40 repeat domain-containing protein [Pseudomonadota bacterium]
MKAQGLSLKALIVLGFVLSASGVSPAAADFFGHGGMVRAVDISPDGSRVLTGSFDFTARLWNFGDQTEIGILDAHRGPVTNVAFVGDGRRALTASDDGTAILWDLETLKPISKLEGHGHKIMGLAVAADGRRAATGSWDKTVRLWDLDQGKETLVIRHNSPINSVVFTHGGKNVAAGDHAGKIRFWDAKSGRLQGTLEGHKMGITQLSVSADGRRLLSASIDKTLKLWDLEKMAEINSFEDDDGPIFAVAFAPDGKTALSAGRYGNLTYRNLADGKIIRAILANQA